MNKRVRTLLCFLDIYCQNVLQKGCSNLCFPQQIICVPIYLIQRLALSFLQTFHPYSYFKLHLFQLEFFFLSVGYLFSSTNSLFPSLFCKRNICFILSNYTSVSFQLICASILLVLLMKRKHGLQKMEDPTEKMNNGSAQASPDCSSICTSGDRVESSVTSCPLLPEHLLNLAAPKQACTDEVPTVWAISPHRHVLL